MLVAGRHLHALLLIYIFIHDWIVFRLLPKLVQSTCQIATLNTRENMHASKCKQYLNILLA